MAAHPDSSGGVPPPPAPIVGEIEALCRSSRTREVGARLGDYDDRDLEPSDQVRLAIARATALFHLGDLVEAIALLRRAVEISAAASIDVQFAAALALFERSATFLAPDETLQELSRLRQLATSIGNAPSLGKLHLAVARVEACRGFCAQARRHLDIARRLADQGPFIALQCSVGLVEAGLELVVGNLQRAKAVADATLQRSEAAGLRLNTLGCAVNLGTVAMWTGQAELAQEHFEKILAATTGSPYVRAGALDSLAQLALFRGDAPTCQRLLDECRRLESSTRLPALSWSQLSHELTQAWCHELTGRWSEVVSLTESIDAELARRQFRALRTLSLCLQARAHARMGDAGRAAQSLAAAVRMCPQGATDPQIVIETSRGVFAALSGDAERAGAHFERARAACHAIGHAYHARWIERQRASLNVPESAPAVRVDLPDAARLLGDAAAILGAGHSMDWLAQRAVATLESVFSADRISTSTAAGRDARGGFSTHWEQAAEGTCRIRLRGPDRSIAIEVRGVRDLDEVSFTKAVADLVRAAVHRSSDRADEDEQSFWPSLSMPEREESVFQSPSMRELLKVALRLASTNVPILLGGETGTGKEIVARLIHEHSRVRQGPFVAYNCSAMPRDLVESQLFGHRRGAFTGAMESFPGLVRSAEKGTLFLDEIGDLDPSVQPKLLRFLESAEIHPIGEMRPQTVHVRIMAATNAHLDRLVEEGRFRRDLFYRLGVARIALPPLRERKDEIPALASLFLVRYSRECQRAGLRLSDDLIAALLMHHWPGNIRELANEIRRVVAMAEDGQTLTSADLSPEILAGWPARLAMPAAADAPRAIPIRLDQPLPAALEELERAFIDRALAAAGGRVSEAAQLLGISRKGLFLKRRRRDERREGSVPARQRRD